MTLRRRSPVASTPSPRVIESPYLTAREAMVYLRVGSQSALYRLIREHQLPHCRRGRLLLFDTREIDAWVHGHESVIAFSRSAKIHTNIRR